MARLYISSTYEDLRDARGVAWNALKKVDHDVSGMEGYAAADARPVELCCQDVASCDGYIGILGSRYGWVPDPTDGKSITRLEYEEAGRRGLPRLMFLMDVPVGQPLEPALAEFRSLARTEQTAKPVKDNAALESEVMAAVVRQFGSGREVPPLLPYLCDRSDQVAAFKTAFEASFFEGGDGRPLLALVHGDEREAHGKFVERLIKKFIPEYWKPTGRRSSAVKSFVLPWPGQWDPPHLGQERLRDGLSMELRVARASEALMAAFARIPGLCFVQAHVLSDDCRRQGEAVIEHFVDFWDSLATHAAAPALVVTLSVKYKTASRWSLGTTRLNKRIEEAVLKVGGRSTGPTRVVTLPRLARVNRNQADEWAARDETRNFSGGQDLGPAIRKTFEDATDSEEIPMEELAQRLRAVLSQSRARREVGP